MKFLLVVLLLILGGVLYAVFGPSSDDSKADAQTPAEQAASNHPREETNLKDDVNKAVGYGAGYYQFKAGQKMKSKAKDVNAQHTKELEEKMKE